MTFTLSDKRWGILEKRKKERYKKKKKNNKREEKCSVYSNAPKVKYEYQTFRQYLY